MDFLEFFNRCGEEAVINKSTFKPATSMDTPINEETVGLDSLDIALTFMLVAEAFDIETVTANTMPRESIKDLKEFCDTHKKRDFETVEEAMKVVK